jgi:hypothetical protein
LDGFLVGLFEGFLVGLFVGLAVGLIVGPLGLLDGLLGGFCVFVGATVAIVLGCRVLVMMSFSGQFQTLLKSWVLVNSSSSYISGFCLTPKVLAKAQTRGGATSGRPERETLSDESSSTHKAELDCTPNSLASLQIFDFSPKAPTLFLL